MENYAITTTKSIRIIAKEKKKKQYNRKTTKKAEKIKS